MLNEELFSCEAKMLKKDVAGERPVEQPRSGGYVELNVRNVGVRRSMARDLVKCGLSEEAAARLLNLTPSD